MPSAAHSPLAGAIRMTLLQDNFINDLPPRRFKAGTVALVNQETADRWDQLGIAVPSEETDKTAAEQMEAKIGAMQAQLEALRSGEATLSAPEVPDEPESKAARRGRVRRG